MELSFYLLLAGPVLSLGALITCLLSMRKVSKFSAELKSVQQQIQQSIGSTHAVNQDNQNTIHTQLQQKLKLMCDGMNLRLDSQDQQMVVLKDSAQSVERHMSVYSAVLESQDRLVTAVSKLADEVQAYGRRHR